MTKPGSELDAAQPGPYLRVRLQVHIALGCPCDVAVQRHIGHRGCGDTADGAAAGTHAAPSGRLTLTGPVDFGRMYVLPIVHRYLAQFTQVDVSCWFVDRIVNLVDEGVDLAVRIGDLPDSSLQAVQVGQVRQVLCASPDYLARHGTPQRPEELAQHVVVAATGVTATSEWRFHEGARQLPVRLQPRLTVNTNEAAAASAATGMDVTRLPLYQIAQAVHEGSLVLVLEAFERAPLPIHVVHREGRNATHKVRAFLDLAVETPRNDARLR